MENLWKYIEGINDDNGHNNEENNMISTIYCDSIINANNKKIYEFIIKLNNGILFTLNRVSISNLSEYNLSKKDIGTIIIACREKCKLEKTSNVQFEKLINGEKSEYIHRYMKENNMLISGKKKLVGK
jgi:hypothetical protein